MTDDHPKTDTSRDTLNQSWRQARARHARELEQAKKEHEKAQQALNDALKSHASLSRRLRQKYQQNLRRSSQQMALPIFDVEHDPIIRIPFEHVGIDNNPARLRIFMGLERDRTALVQDREELAKDFQVSILRLLAENDPEVFARVVTAALKRSTVDKIRAESVIQTLESVLSVFDAKTQGTLLRLMIEESAKGVERKGKEEQE